MSAIGRISIDSSVCGGRPTIRGLRGLTRLGRERAGCRGEFTPSLVRYLSSPLLAQDDRVEPPSILNKVPLEVPDAARRRGLQGVIILDLLLSPEGCVTDVRVVRAIPILDAAAVDFVLRWQLSPTRRNGEAVSAWVGHSLNLIY